MTIRTHGQIDTLSMLPASAGEPLFANGKRLSTGYYAVIDSENSNLIDWPD